MISVRRLAGTSSSFASARADRPSGTRYSSRSTSPGCVRTRAIVASSMIVRDLHGLRAVRRPAEADAPLPVDTNGILSAAIASQCFQPIARRGAQIIKPGCCVHHVQLAQGHVLDAPPARRAD